MLRNAILMLSRHVCLLHAPPLSQCPTWAHPIVVKVWTHPSSPDLTICPNVLEHLQNVQLSEKWENKSLVSTAHWTDPWQFENSLCPLLFADFDEFLLHQAAPIQTGALLIYCLTRCVWGWCIYQMQMVVCDVKCRCRNQHYEMIMWLVCAPTHPHRATENTACEGICNIDFVLFFSIRQNDT